ncbi:YopJ family acetyltransferase [Cedecea neteri]|uniref:Effector protein YopJ n=1 Tax=Cedecea neteri TaxID=158822 RepID=A0A291E1P2_9ENTR|nr:YopJ family acetyltransferase [Cedecea neteri]ATF93819.1 hypothetical protein CO704_17780 [Cedecea neteri]
MGYFNRIKKDDSLIKAMSRKINQKKISERTGTLINDRISKASMCTLEKSYQYLIEQLSTPTRNYMLTSLQKNTVTRGINPIINDYERGNQPGIETNRLDDIVMSLLASALSKKKGLKIIHFASIYEFIQGVKLYRNGTCIVRMGDEEDYITGHYTAIEFRTLNDRPYILLYEPSFLQNTKEAGTDYGLQLLKKHAQYIYAKIGFIEVSTQRSQDDCAIFSLFIANKFRTIKTFNDSIFNNMEQSDKKIIYYYERSNKHYIKNFEQKVALDVPAELLKHGHSLKSLSLRGDEIINSKGQSLSERAQKHAFQSKEGRIYSTSIELKRISYYKEAMKYLGISDYDLETHC